MRELNLQAIAQCCENSAAACKGLPSSGDLAAPLTSQWYAKPEIMGPQNCRDRQSPDAMIKDFGVLLDNMQDAMHCMAKYSGMGEFIKHTSGNKSSMSDE